MLLSLLSLVMVGAVLCLLASIFITLANPKVGLQVAAFSALTIFVDLFLLSLF